MLGKLIEKSRPFVFVDVSHMVCNLQKQNIWENYDLDNFNEPIFHFAAPFSLFGDEI